MASLTFREVPADLLEALRKRADQIGATVAEVVLDMCWAGLAITESDGPTQEAELRARAHQLGYRLEHAPALDRQSADVGGYRLVDAHGLVVLGGSRAMFSASPAELVSFLQTKASTGA